MVFGHLSRHGVCPGSANGSRLVLGCMQGGREVGMGKTEGVLGSKSVTSGWWGSDKGKCGAAGEVGAPVQVRGSPSSLTNFEIDL